MTTIQKRAIWGVFVVLGMTFITPAQAQECDLRESQFENLSKNSYSNLQAELALRKSLLGKTLACAIEEAAGLKSAMEQTRDDASIQKTKFRILDLLGNAIEYYKLELAKIPGIGLEGSRYFARDLRSWREGNYSPVAKTAVNFTLWTGNQDLIQTAKNRLAQIGQTVTLLKLVENKGIQEQWETANTLYNSAVEENQNARLALENLDPENALSAIKLSLENLAHTYKTLSELIAEINNLTSKIQSSKKTAQ